MKKRVAFVILVLVLGIVVLFRRSSGPRDFELRLLYTTNSATGTDGMFELRSNSADAAMCVGIFWEKDTPRGTVDYLGSGVAFQVPPKTPQRFSTKVPTNGGADRLVMAILPSVSRYGKGPFGRARNWLVRLSRPIPAVAWWLAGGTRCESEFVNLDAVR